MDIRSVYRDHVRGREGLNRAASRAYSLAFRGRRRVVGQRNVIDLGDVSWLKRLRLDVHGDDNIVTLGQRCRVSETTIRVWGNGNRVHIGEDVFLEAGEIAVEDDGNVVQVGAGTALCSGFHLAATEGRSLQVGERCLFSSDVQVRTGDSHSIFDSSGVRINPAQDTVVGEHVWIGRGAALLKGAQVPPDSVVGTHAVVTGAFDEPGSILAGSPARCLRTGISWDGARASEAQE